MTYPWEDSRRKDLLAAGDVVRGMTVLLRIGRGGSGETYLVKEGRGRPLALKVLYGTDATREPEGIRLLAGIPSQKGILPILGQGELPSGHLWYLMPAADNLKQFPEYLPDTLATRLARQGRFSWEEVVKVAKGLLRALDGLHRRGISHGDIKPENVLFVDGEPCLCDFGLLHAAADSGYTRGGTWSFLPPEVREGREVFQAYATQNDLYALSKTLYCIWTGRGPSEYPLLHDAPKATELHVLRRFLLKGCEENPAYRYKSAEEMERALTAAGSAGVSSSASRLQSFPLALDTPEDSTNLQKQREPSKRETECDIELDQLLQKSWKKLMLAGLCVFALFVVGWWLGIMDDIRAFFFFYGGKILR